MKKHHLLSLLALASPFLAHAQSSSNVTLFGMLDTSVNLIDQGGSGSTPGHSTQELSGLNGQSRLGVKGAEDLGGGLQAKFHLEGAIASNSGAGTGTGGAFTLQRRSVVGLSGSYGDVWIGRDYTPGFQVQGAVSDVAAAAGWQNGLYGTTLINWTVNSAASAGIRWSNGVHYVSPSFDGLVIRAAYAFGNNPSPNQSAGNSVGVSARYDQPRYAAYGFYHRMNDAAPATTQTTQSGVGGVYKWENLRLSYGYATLNPQAGTKYVGQNLGAAAKVGPGWLMAQAMKVQQDALQAVGKSYALSYVYPLSKRTDLTVSAGTMRNNSQGSFALRASDFQGSAAAPGSTLKGMGFGLAHWF